MKQAYIAALTPQQTILLGFILAVLYTVFFAGIGLTVKLAGETHDPIEIVFYRNFFGMIILLPFFLTGGRFQLLLNANKKRQVTRAIVGTNAMFFTFWAFTVLPLSEAQSILFAAPLFVTLLSWPLLGEKVGPYRIAAVFIGFIGVLVVLNPSAMSSMSGAVIALAAAIGHAAIMLMLRWMGRTENAIVTVMYFFSVGALIVLPALPFYFTMPTPESMLILITIGVLAVAVQYCLTWSYFLAPAAMVAPISYFSLIWALGLDIWIWSFMPGPEIFIGAAIIIASNLFILYREQKKKQKITTT